ncbi:hypothetical protein C5S31_00430 [ANME-1 cluster archaeon GoMg2]|nr:hypothetical protein [ANME-1 cluster archaeon GoMg2]
MLMLMSITPVAVAISGLWLDTIPPSPYVGPSGDAWLLESTVTADTSFDLTLYNHNGGDIYYMYLLVAVNKVPAGNVTVKVNNTEVNPYDGVITSNKALVSETADKYEFAPHGIYNYYDVHFNVTTIPIESNPGDTDGDGIFEEGETLSVPIEILPTTPTKVHFDAVGADSDNKAIARNPGSHDVTYNVPEFSTIAIPVAAIFGLLFFFNRRKRRKE